MIRCRPNRVKAPDGCLAHATLRWPVTVWRARLHVPNVPRSDPFARLVLDCAFLGKSDPAWIARLIDVHAEFVSAVRDSLVADGALDAHGRLTQVGEARRLEVEVVEYRYGWVLRDDLTGAAFPILVERDLQYLSFREDELDVWPEGQNRPGDPGFGWRVRLVDVVRMHLRLERGAVVEGDDDAPESMADAAQRATVEGDVELVGSGIWETIPVDVWFERTPDGPALRVGCPFGRFDDGGRYLQRLMQARQRHPLLEHVLGELKRRAQEQNLAWEEDERDEAVKAATADVLNAIRSRSLPARISEHLEDAELRRLRAERGRERFGMAILQYGLVAEAVLCELVPLAGPDPQWVASWAATLPAAERAVANLLADRIAELAPPDDDGHGFDVPAPVRNVLPLLVQQLVTREESRWAPAFRKWPKNLFHGSALLALPLVMAVVPTATPDPRVDLVRRVVSDHRTVWRHLAVMLSHRNDKGAHLHSIGEARLRDALREVAAAATHVIEALFPVADQDAS